MGLMGIEHQWKSKTHKIIEASKIILLSSQEAPVRGVLYLISMASGCATTLVIKDGKGNYLSQFMHYHLLSLT